MASCSYFFYLLGQLVDTVRVKKGDQILFSSMFEANITTHNIAVIVCKSLEILRPGLLTIHLPDPTQPKHEIRQVQ